MYITINNIKGEARIDLSVLLNDWNALLKLKYNWCISKDFPILSVLISHLVRSVLAQGPEPKSLLMSIFILFMGPFNPKATVNIHTLSLSRICGAW